MKILSEGRQRILEVKIAINRGSSTWNNCHVTQVPTLQKGAGNSPCLREPHGQMGKMKQWRAVREEERGKERWEHPMIQHLHQTLKHSLFVSYFWNFQLDVYRFLDFNKLTQWFSDFSTHKNHLEAFTETLLLPTPNPKVFYFICVGETWEFAFLSSRVMLLMVWATRFGNHCSKIYLK